MPDFTSVGSSKWSHDGRKNAFDAARKVMSENIKHVFVVRAETTIFFRQPDERAENPFCSRFAQPLLRA